MQENAWTTDWQVGIRVWIERAGQAVLGEGRAELLAAIERERSITKAAKSAGMSYRRAWTMVQEINAAAGVPLVTAAVGGKSGGGARLTSSGRLAMSVYEEIRQSLVQTAAGSLQRTIRGGGGDAIHLAAAISLQQAISQILAEYTLRVPAIRVRTIFGASNELADHILAGAPGDLFISAEPRELHRLQAAGMVVAESRRVIARNGLAIVGLAKVAKLRRAADLLAKRFKHVAMAEPACPLGSYSRAYLSQVGVYDDLIPKILPVDNSRAVLAAVVSGAADVGVAFASDAESPGAWRLLMRVPPALAAATYEAAVITTNKRRQEVLSLCDFLSTTTAARCLRRCGLRPADG
jgi:molybdenum ABC transporter molybdate-binding protein